VICDRFFDATFAYQGAGRGIDNSVIETATKLISPFYVPTLTILLDAPSEVGLKRIKSRSEIDRFEEQSNIFFDRIRAAYLDRARNEPQRFSIIDATQPLPMVQRDIETILGQKFTSL